MFAICEIAGKQYKIQEKEKLLVDLLPLQEGEELDVDKVLLYVADKTEDPLIGTPYLDGYTVTLKVLGLEKGDKIKVFKMNPKKRYSRTRGHRQQYTLVEVVKIGLKEKKNKPAIKSGEIKEEKVFEEKKEVTKKVTEKKTDEKKPPKKVAKKTAKKAEPALF